MIRRLLFWGVVTVSFAVRGYAGEASEIFSGDVTIMTRNLYFGADVYRILEAKSLAEVPLKVTEILNIVDHSRPPERMDAIAGEIAKTRPHLVGLQEVYLIRTQFPGDFLSGSNTPAEDVRYDYLELLLESLRSRGLDYRVAAVVEEADVELPGFAGIVEGQPQFFDGRITDRDVILARGDVATANPIYQHYQALVPLELGGIVIESTRGFASVDAWVGERKYHFVDTHLEIEEGARESTNRCRRQSWWRPSRRSRTRSFSWEISTPGPTTRLSTPSFHRIVSSPPPVMRTSGAAGSDDGRKGTPAATPSSWTIPSPLSNGASIRSGGAIPWSGTDTR